VRDGVLGVAAVVPLLLGSVMGGDEVDGRVEMRFQDPQITEASGLVVRDGLVVTVNDSGDTARVFTVDPSTGRTVGVTSWDAEPVDDEALAPAGPGKVWVGDIGDNDAVRPSVTVTRVPVGRGDRDVAGASYELVYPDGAVDAETLLADPTTGRLYLVSKEVFGGTVYAAPEQLDPDGPNRLRPVGRALGIATDGAFLPDGEHVVVRDYRQAAFYTWPGLDLVGEVDLPAERQGEAIAVDEEYSIHVTSEGIEAPVLRVDLPTRLARRVAPATAPIASPAPSPEVDREGSELPEAPSSDRAVWPWFLTGWIGLAVIVALVFALRRPPRQRRQDDARARDPAGLDRPS
jgi:hypothetical protein